MQRPPQSLKDAANRLAQALASGDGSVFRWMKHFLYAAYPPDLPIPNLRDPSTATKPRRIGIWECEFREGEPWYVRSTKAGERAGLWSNARLIPPKRKGRRVVLLGESVARGYFFDPYFNPAMVLQQMLRKAAPARDVDVVDLASIGMLQESLLEVAGAAVDLRSDAVVVLAGNNWWRTAVNLNFIHFQEMAQILRSSGSWADVKAYQEGLLSAHALFGIETLCQLAREHKFHLIIALPEFNLLDWRTSADNPPMLTPAQTIEWRSLREEGERALARHDCDTAKICGLRMLHLDQGTTPEGDNLLGKAHSLAGNWIEARRHYEKARDSVICWPHPGSPRCYSVIQQTIRQEAAKGHFVLVDLPQAFTEHWNSGLPDRRMFLDYCHFTVDAAHVAMAAVAEPLLLSLFGIHRNVRDLSSIRVQVNPKFEAEGHFLAAVHNANWGQDAEIVRYHCGKAISLSSDVGRMMTLFLDFHIRHAPASLCRSFEELCQLQNISAISLLFNPHTPIEPKFLNLKLINEIVNALQEKHPDLKAQNDTLLAREHGVHGHDTDLLQNTYSVDSAIVPFDQPVFAYYKAKDRISSFIFWCERAEPVWLTFTYRCRQYTGKQPILASVQGVVMATIPSSTSWKTVTIAAEFLRSGINRVDIEWPMPEWDLSTWKDQIAQLLEGGQFTGIHPVYGEIHRLQASVTAPEHRAP